jgi:hypothetical protein
MARFASAAAARQFIEGGNATFTIKSERTGAHFTFRARAKKDGSVTFLSLLNGPDNEADFAYVGLLRDGKVVTTSKSRITKDAPSIRALSWALEQIANDNLPPVLGVYHEGRCGRCNRKLTHPESIETGFGPECAGRLR